ncbi:MAG: pilus assembly protein PilM [Planctomycetota bacterium]
MFASLTQSKTRTIGVDIGRRAVRLVQHDGSASTAAAQAPIRGEHRCRDEAFVEAAVDAVKRALDAGTFVGRAAAVALPTSVLKFTSVRMPEMPEAEMAEAIKWESDGSTEPGVETIRQYVKLGQVRQGEEARQEVLMMTADRRWIESFVDGLDGLGLDLDRLDFSGNGLLNVVPVGDEPRLVIDFGADSTRAMIVERGVLRFYKVIGAGQNDFDRLVAERLRVPLGDAAEARRQADGDAAASRGVQEAIRTPTEELARELSLCIRYFGVSFRGARPEQGLAVGGGATFPQLLDELGRASGVTLEALDPFDTAGLDAVSVEQPWAWSTAVGLAHHGPVRHVKPDAQREAA